MAARPRLITRLFVLVWIAGFLQELAWSLLVHFPGFLSELDATESRIGALYAGSALLALVIRPLLGRIMDHTGRRRVLLGAGAINIVAVLGLIAVGTFGPVLFGLFIVHRVMQIVLFTAMLTFNADIVPRERRTEGLALLGLAGLLPIATGGILGDGLLAAGGFDTLFAVAAIGSSMSWLVVLRLPRRVSTGAVRPRRSFFAALVQRDLLPLWLVTFLFAVSLETLFTYIRTFVDTRGVGTVGVFFVAYGGVAVVARTLASGRLDAFAHRPVLGASLLAFAAAFLLLASAESLLPFLLAAFLCGLAHGIAFPVMSSEVVGRTRTAERGSAMAIFTAIFDLALLTAAPLAGLLIDWFSYAVGFTATAVFLALGVALYAAWDRATAVPVEPDVTVSHAPI